MAVSTAVEWRSLQQRAELRDGLFIDGAFRPARSGETFPTVNPATGEVLAKVASADRDDVHRAVVSARRAFAEGSWSAASPDHRRRVLLRLAELVEARSDELALVESLDSGKRVVDAREVDLPSAVAVIRFYAEAIDKVYGEVAPTARGDLAFVSRVPLGVVGAVVPWNFPLDMAVWKVAPALAAGNSVVLKPAEETPLSALILAELAFEAGVPEGVFNVVPGLGETAGQALGRHPDVDCLTFTGSTAVGKLFMSYSGESNLKQVWLECGGKSPNLVFDDAEDLDTVAEMACFGAFFNQGEVCSANTRLLVQRSIHDDLVGKLCERAGAYSPGDPLDADSGAGALVSETHLRRVLDYVALGNEHGDLVAGGHRLGDRGCFVEPTIFTNVDNESPIAQEEVFGPVLVVIPFDTEDEAVAMANRSPYGLAASVWTSSLSRAHRVAERLQVGTVSVNTVDALSPQTPFGGFKGSGFGRDLSLHALEKFTGLKTTWISYA